MNMLTMKILFFKTEWLRFGAKIVKKNGRGSFCRTIKTRDDESLMFRY
jgi:hypothetical protein